MTKYSAFVGDDGFWGIEDQDEAILYEATFCRVTAESLADLYNSERPPRNWFEAEKLLKAMGLPI